MTNLKANVSAVLTVIAILGACHLANATSKADCKPGTVLVTKTTIASSGAIVSQWVCEAK